MTPRKPAHHFGLAMVMGLFAFFPFRLNPDSFSTVDFAAVIFFGLLAAIFVILGVVRWRRDDTN